MDESSNPFVAYAGVLGSVAEVVPGYRRMPLSVGNAGVLILSTFGLPSLDRVLVPRLSDDEALIAVSRVEGEARAAGVAVNCGSIRELDRRRSPSC